ncbi:hypothetical protein FALBO_9364 [Fusarium albosuccineum]|uniref:Uncharacterized protein n=1 Tax=Fusarium albosuccineum TaxID=1237068 RepID=A0A8H4P607_9HYPO|nr:hypothetical protein FALBO_9364 [Fusarium albosuccineum]
MARTPALPASEGDTLFIITTPSAPSVEARRKTIRSHVMRGKNREKPPPRPSSWTSSGEDEKDGALSITPKVGGEFSFTPIPDELGPEVMETVRRLRRATVAIQFGPATVQSDASWFEPIVSDTACMHFTLFISKVWLNSMQGTATDKRQALVHHGKALSTLQQRLASGDVKQATSDSTVLVVLGLTTAALGFGDLANAENHMRGLHKMATMRGGLSEFKTKKQLQGKIYICVALSTGNNTYFFSEGLPWKSYLVPKPRNLITPAPGTSNSYRVTSSSVDGFLRCLDPRLRRVWDDLEECSRSANIATQCNLIVDTELYHEVGVSVHYRLLHLRFDSGTANEITRLGLMGYASSLFLQGHGIKMRHKHLCEQLEREMFSGGNILSTLPPQLCIWLYVICIGFVLDDRDHDVLRAALSQLLRAEGLTSWDEVRAAMKSVLWVNELHDAASRQVIESVLSEI